MIWRVRAVMSYSLHFVLWRWRMRGGGCGGKRSIRWMGSGLLKGTSGSDGHWKGPGVWTGRGWVLGLEASFDFWIHHLTAGPGKFHSLQLSLSASSPSPSHPWFHRRFPWQPPELLDLSSRRWEPHGRNMAKDVKSPPHRSIMCAFRTRQNASSSVSRRKLNIGFGRHRGRENNPKYLLRPVPHPRIQSEISTEPLPGARHFPRHGE